ncbi:MAG: hypothetical protein NZO58_00175 [Gemmataceae bacterium]|nr:hypothetical protein [Gemmataceae bacterium]
MIRRTAIVGTIAFWFAVPALLGACRSGDDKVTVYLLVILAKEEGNVVDKRLQEFAREVREKNPNFTSFALKTMTKVSLAPQQKHVFKLVDGKTAQVVVRHGADKHNKVSLAVTPPDQGEIVYVTVCGKYLPIITPYQTKNKERLMLAISVQPCNE